VTGAGSLASAVVVVTGAATGVGRALAVEAAARGARVVVLDIEEPAETVELITTAGGSARAVVADVSDREAMQQVAGSLAREEDHLDVLCANAGIGVGGGVDDISCDTLRSVLDVNVVGVFNTVQAFLPLLRGARTGGRDASILITGSEHSLGVPPYVPAMTAYTTSKYALLGLAACLRRDLGDDGIGVSILCPSYVRTERLREYAADSAEIAQVLDTYGQDGDVVAGLGFDGIAEGHFFIPTSPASRDFVVAFHQEAMTAMEAVPGRP
jgi:NAD(P)-dependent dehydrogenase (short-subunit alcohol dehydrogenase family)